MCDPSLSGIIIYSGCYRRNFLFLISQILVLFKYREASPVDIYFPHKIALIFY